MKSASSCAGWAILGWSHPSYGSGVVDAGADGGVARWRVLSFCSPTIKTANAMASASMYGIIIQRSKCSHFFLVAVAASRPAMDVGVAAAYAALRFVWRWSQRPRGGLETNAPTK